VDRIAETNERAMKNVMAAAAFFGLLATTA
jgi:hypothetical protein